MKFVNSMRTHDVEGSIIFIRIRNGMESGVVLTDGLFFGSKSPTNPLPKDTILFLLQNVKFV